jgi:hypothetical protein
MGCRQRLDADDLEYEAMVFETPPPPTCITGKRIIESASAAAYAAKSMRMKKADPFFEPYFCDDCGFWHVGHAIGTKRARIDLIRSSKGKGSNEANPRAKSQ